LQALEILKSNNEKEHLDVLSSLHEWGLMSALGMARTSFILIDEDKESMEDDMEQSLIKKYHEVKKSIDDLKSQFSGNVLMMGSKNKHLTKSLSMMAVYTGILDNNVEKMLKHFAADDVEKEEAKELFFTMYDDIAGNYSEQIYAAIKDSQSNIFKEAALESKYNKKETMHFIKATSLLLLNTITIDTTYNLLKYGGFVDGLESDEAERIMESTYKLWKDKLKNVGQIIKREEKQVTDQWKRQYSVDIDEYLENRAPLLSNSSIYGKSIAKMLKEKYPWRKWTVLLTNSYLQEKKQFAVVMCGRYQYKRLHAHLKHVFVTSIEEDHHFDERVANSELKRALAKIQVWSPEQDRAEKINDNMNPSCRQFTMFGTIEKAFSADVAIVGDYKTADTSIVGKSIPSKSFETAYLTFIAG